MPFLFNHLQLCSWTAPFSGCALLCNSAVAFLFVLIRFQHSYGYQTKAQIATYARMDILRFKCLRSVKLHQKSQFREMSGGREVGVIFLCEDRGVGFFPLKDGIRKKQMGRELAPELPR